MAAKMDKEMMKKHHFWLLLIPVMIGLLLAWIGLFVIVGGETADIQAKNKTERQGVDSAKAQPRKTLELYEARKGELGDLRMKRWKEMWDAQQAVYTWPKALGEEQIEKVKNKNFGDDIPNSSFLDAFRDHYAKDYEVLAKDAEPLQFAGGWRNVLRHVGVWARTPEAEDVWLAMEDFWVQREIVESLAKVNTEAAKFTRRAEGTPFERSFSSRTWSLDLKIVDGKNGNKKIVGKIRNLTNRLQPYGANGQLVFKIWLDKDENAKPFLFTVEGMSLGGSQEEVIKEVEAKHTVFEGRVTELFKVEQVFDARTVPVKRLDQLQLGYLSARHSQAELQMTAFSQKTVDALGMGDMMGMGGGMLGMGGFPPPPGMGSGSMSGVGAPPPMMIGTGFGGGQLGGQATTNSTDRTYNQLERRRYMNRSEQVRAMPIGAAIVVDQGYVQDVLTALANSILRVQIVQMHFSRFRGNLSYELPSTPGSFPPGMGSGMGSNVPPTGMGSNVPPMGMGSTPGGVGAPPPMMIGVPPRGGVFPPPPGDAGGAFGSFGAPRSSSEDQASGNLVSLSIYGIASLYEKFRIEPKKDANAGFGNPTNMNPMGMVPPMNPMGMVPMGMVPPTMPMGMGMVPPTMPMGMGMVPPTMPMGMGVVPPTMPMPMLPPKK